MATLSTAAKNAAINALTTLMDLGGTRCRLRLFTAGFGSTLMNVHLTAATPTWGAASGGAATVNNLPNVYSLTGTGTIAGYSLDNGAGTGIVFNASGVGDLGSGADMEMNVRAVVSGQIIRVNSIELSFP